MDIDSSIIRSFTGKMKKILDRELKAGNRISETYQGDWPYKNCKIIFLEKPFVTQILRDMQGIKFCDIDDPHYWKAQYFDARHNLLLCCRFGERPG